MLAYAFTDIIANLMSFISYWGLSAVSLAVAQLPDILVRRCSTKNLFNFYLRGRRSCRKAAVPRMILESKRPHLITNETIHAVDKLDKPTCKWHSLHVMGCQYSHKHMHKTALLVLVGRREPCATGRRQHTMSLVTTLSINPCVRFR